ncbi:PDT-domain-containing protein [Basidiobolus meristosporus CBS 931.73]|uniref:prephenate dehydratase n=1 Tax=Basidiobolus meristosporus CBS 931.73 TaxID=1314790 RepID=A0A1Y1YT20_9FUNG|nr:PDT-domain-containing protein [Basidiobolus meristosporus CBS 931.73]|eukprot:ORY01161.1 PDT-domain-containing protein [Basidiobolus meristosporus CBS 931.73]
MAEGKILLGYHGSPGAYADNAARHLFQNHATFRGKPFETVPYDTLNQMLSAVQNGDIHQAILPVENSLSGTIHANFDKLIKMSNPRVFVVGEYVFYEPCCLIGVKGSRVEDIQEIQSHTHIIEQCMEFIHSLPNGDSITISQGESTSSCAKHVSERNERQLAAIASKNTAQIYDLEILATGIEQSSSIFTRYFLLSKDPIVPERHMSPKSSYAVIMNNKPGALFKTLGSFAMRDINILKIESRPSTRTIRYATPWEYIIYIDIDGAMETNPLVEKAVDNLKEFATQVIKLGSYPRYINDMGDFSPICY